MNESSHDIRFYMVDDGDAERRVMQDIFALEPGFHLLGASATVSEGVRRVIDLAPDIVLLDLNFPRERVDGLFALREFRSVQWVDRAPRCIIYSNYTWDAPHWDWLGEAYRLGAWGYVAKGPTFDPLVQAMREVHAGEYAFLGVPEGVLASLHEQNRNGAVPQDLTALEIEACRLLVAGHSPKQIGLKLGRGERAALARLERAAARLRCGSIQELSVMLQRTRLLDHTAGA